MKFLKKKYKNLNGILSFEIRNKETTKITNFYKETPFPNYKKEDNKQSILEKGNKNFLASQSKRFIGYNKNILEAGCGTGQLSIYFSIGTNNNVVALDPKLLCFPGGFGNFYHLKGRPIFFFELSWYSIERKLSLEDKYYL